MSERYVAEKVGIIDNLGEREAICVTDTVHTVSFEVKDENVALRLCELLNEQQTEIDDLKKENEKLKIALGEYGVDFSSLDKFKEAIGYNEMVNIQTFEEFE